MAEDVDVVDISDLELENTVLEINNAPVITEKGITDASVATGREIKDTIIIIFTVNVKVMFSIP